MPPQDLTFKQVIAYPKKYLSGFVKYWKHNLPDMSEREIISPSKMQYWKRSAKKGKKSKDELRAMGRAPHKLLPALQGKWVNYAMDKAMENNQWAVCFRDKNGAVVNMCFEFGVIFWCAYGSRMKGNPEPDSKAAQRVLLYLCTEQESLSRVWRNRLYYYSSGTIYTSLNVDFSAWFAQTGHQEACSALRKVRVIFIRVSPPMKIGAILSPL